MSQSATIKKESQSNDLSLLVYVSKIRPDLAIDPVKLNATTTHILGQANKNNIGKELTGILFYGQYHFLQCIEGPKITVQELFEVIKGDDRHDHVQLLLNAKIDHRYFPSWVMKFVDSNTAIMNFFQQHGLANFEPEKLNKQDLKALIKLLTQI